MPVYNREQFIKFAIDSILNQSYSNIELIIYDDGSTDNTVKIIKSYQKIDKRVKLLVGDKNRGVGYARNQLLKACNTKFAIWQDSDDVSSPNRIQIQIRKSDGGSLVFANWKWLHKHLGKWKQREKEKGANAFASLFFPVDKEILFDINKISGGEDWDWIKRMQKKYNTIITPKVLYFVRFHHDRIGSWKRKLRKEFGGVFTAKELKNLSYAEAIAKYKELKRG